MSVAGVKHQEWTQAETDMACRLWKAGHTATEVMRELTQAFGRKFTRNSVISRLYRVMPDEMMRAAASGTRADWEVVARAHGGSRAGVSIFTTETDDLLLKCLSIGQNAGDAARLIATRLGKIYTPQQLNDRARALKYRTNRMAQRKANPALSPIFTPEVEAEIKRLLSATPAPTNQHIALHLRDAFPANGMFTQKTVMEHKRAMRDAGDLPEVVRGHQPWPKTLAEKANPAALVTSHLHFKPENRLDFEWGAEALGYWSDPMLDDRAARWLLRPGHGKWRDYGFYVQWEGRTESAWWLYTGGEIDIVTLQAEAKRYFWLCGLSDEENARLWRRRFREKMTGAGVAIMALRRRLRGVSATPWATLESMIYGTSPGNASARRELENALADEIAGAREMAA